MEKYTYSPGVDAPPTGAIAKLTVGTILKAMYLRKAFEKKKKEPYFCGDLGFCVFLCMGLVFVFGDFPTFCFFSLKILGWISATWPFGLVPLGIRGMARRRSSPRSSMGSQRRRCPRFGGGEGRFPEGCER